MGSDVVVITGADAGVQILEFWQLGLQTCHGSDVVSLLIVKEFTPKDVSPSLLFELLFSPFFADQHLAASGGRTPGP